jgi:hypothetical protein
LCPGTDIAHAAAAARGLAARAVPSAGSPLRAGAPHQSHAADVLEAGTTSDTPYRWMFLEGRTVAMPNRVRRPRLLGPPVLYRAPRAGRREHERKG